MLKLVTTEEGAGKDKATATRRPLTCRGVYGAPGGDGLDSLAHLLLAVAADEAPQPNRQPDPCLLLLKIKQG